MRMSKLFQVCALVLGAGSYCQAESPLPTNRPILEIQLAPVPCGPRNAMYELQNTSSMTLNAVVCLDKTEPGRSHSRQFKNYEMWPGRKVTLGCEVDSGRYGQRFYVAWQWTNVESFPSNVTDPNKVIFSAYQARASNGVSTWYLVNGHHFKPVTIDYIYNGRTYNDSVKGGDVLLMLGRSASAPRVTKVRYHSLYMTQCVGGTDQYPRAFSDGKLAADTENTGPSNNSSQDK